MKKTILCFLAAALMLTVCVSALQSEPDAQGNVVCSGQGHTTKYNPEKLGALMFFLSDPSMVSVDSPDLVECLEDGSVKLDYRVADGSFIEFAKIKGAVTANPSTNKIEIADGALFPLETPNDNRIAPISTIGGKQLTIQFVKDAQQRIKPMFRISNDGAVFIEEDSIFFACLKKDANGRALQCGISGQLYKEGNAEGYLTITGSGFVSEDVEDPEGQNMLSNYLSGSNNIEELEESSGLDSPEDFIAIPLTDLKEIKVINAQQRDPSNLDLHAKAQAETTAVDYLRVKSNEEIVVNDFISLYRPAALYGDAGRIEITGKDNVKVIASPERLREGTPFLIELDEYDKKAELFMSGSRIAQTDSDIYVFPESAEDAYNAFSADYATAYDSILLKQGSKEMKIDLVDSVINAYLPSGYENVTITPETGSVQGSVKVTNPANGAWILYEDNDLTWTPGRSIQRLGFNFNVNLNPTAGDAGMLSCTTDGICWLGDTMVIGAIPERIRELKDTMPAQSREREEGEGQKGTGNRCENDADCGNDDYICYKRPGTADRYGICRYSTPADRRDRQRVEQGTKSAEEAQAQCAKCGEGTFNLCDREECESLGSCYFREKTIGGSCTAVIATTPRQLSGEEFEEIIGEGEKAAGEENACRAAGGRCRDICYENEFKAYSGSGTPAAPHNSCRLISIAGQPSEQRWCCLPKEEEGHNSCEILGGTCNPDPHCGMNWFKDIIGGHSYRASLDRLPEASTACGAVLNVIEEGEHPVYSYSSGDVCCLNAQLCEYLPCD